MLHFLLYLIVLAAYVPGLCFLVRRRDAGKLPLVLFYFLGLFVFQAVGSILVMGRRYGTISLPNLEPVPGRPLMSWEYVVMLVLQVLLFYALAGPYVYLRLFRPGTVAGGWIASFPKSITNIDRAFSIALAAMSISILCAYRLQVGGFLFTDLIAGRITHDKVLQYREMTYGLADFWFYRLGFFVFPAILAVQIVSMCSVRNRFDRTSLLAILACLVPPLLLGEKSGVLHIVLILIIAYTVYLAETGRGLAGLLKPMVILGMVLAFIPSVFFYWLYFGGWSGRFVLILQNLTYRIVGVYSEALAGVVLFVDQYGTLQGRSLPTVKGLFPHARYNLEAAMHSLLYHGEIDTTVSGLSGSVPVSAAGEGYINFGWPGFILFSMVACLCVVGIQELFLRLRMGVISLSMMVWYAYLSLKLSMTGLFPTFVSFVHTYVFVFAVLFFVVGFQVSRRWASMWNRADHSCR